MSHKTGKKWHLCVMIEMTSGEIRFNLEVKSVVDVITFFNDDKMKSNITLTYCISSTESCHNANFCCPWWHWRLSFWQPTVPPVTTKLALWQLYVFSVVAHKLCDITCYWHYVIYLWFYQSTSGNYTWLSGEPDYFGRNEISSGGDLSHYSSASLY